MKLKSIIIIFILYGLTSTIHAQIRIKGSVQSSLYSWENLAQNQQWDFYQGLNLRVSSTNHPNVYLQTYMRVSQRGDPSEWDERLYNTYLNFRSQNRKFEARIGRQFLYSGVINGTVDGIQATVRPNNDISFKVVVGTDAPLDRSFEIQDWDNGTVLGGYLSVKFKQSNLDLSYFQRSRFDDTVWQLLGAALNGKLNQNFYYQSRLDYNLEKSTYQGMRYRVTYLDDNWSISGEFNSQKPRVYEDSFFNIFELRAFNQFRFGVTRQFGSYNLGVQNILTDYYNDKNYELILTTGTRWGTIGVIAQNGFGGNNTGLYGEIHYDIVHNLTFKARSSYHKYERRSIQISEDEKSFMAGLSYRPIKELKVQAELQESQNSYFDNDLRGLFRLNYSFNH